MAKGIPFVISDNGLGIPVTAVFDKAPPAFVSTNGFGTPVVLTGKGAPFVIGGRNALIPGPLEVYSLERDGFTAFSRPYDLASDSIIVGLACTFRGDPVISMAHGGEPLTIISQQRTEDVLALLAVGTGMTTEAANFTVSAVGGNLDGGAMRINEMQTIAPPLVGWQQAGTGAAGSALPVYTMTGTSGGTVKGVFADRGIDRLHEQNVIGAEIVYNGLATSGIPIAADFSTAGPWTIGDGWSIDGADFVHTGDTLGTIQINFPVSAGKTSIRSYVEVADGARLRMGASGSDVYEGPTQGFICSSLAGTLNNVSFTARGDVRVKNISAVGDSAAVAFTFYSTSAEDGKTLTYTMPYQPPWAIIASEILGQNYSS